jgi:hypothetical protein
MTEFSSAFAATGVSGGAIDPLEEPGKDTSSAKDTLLVLESTTSGTLSGTATAGDRKVGNGLGNWKK